MSAITQSARSEVPRRGHHILTTAFFGLSFWAIAALLVAGCDEHFVKRSIVACVVAKLGVIALASFAYIHLTAPEATVSHALLIGASWLLLSIVTEVTIATRVHHGWFELIGDPANAIARYAVLFAWVLLPSLFATDRPESQ